MKQFVVCLLLIIQGLTLVKAQIQPTSSPYCNNGIYSVIADSATVSSKKVVMYRPSIPPVLGKYPVFIFQPGANGIFGGDINVHTYDLFLQHLTTWGFVVLVIDETTAGLPNGTTFKSVHTWLKTKIADTQHWLNTYADSTKVVIGGHSNGGVNASALLIDRPDEITGIVYFASYPSDNILMPHDVSGYTGKVLSLAGSEDNSSTPSACKNGYNAFTSASCKSYAMITGMGHGAFGDYQHSSQVVGSIGRTDATATIRHYLLGFMLSQFKNDPIALNNLTQSTMQPNTTGEFLTTCGSTVGTDSFTQNNIKLCIYPNPASDFLVVEANHENMLHLYLYNMAGQLLESFSMQSKRIININTYEKGKYFLVAEADSNTRKVFTFIRQ